MNGLTRRQAVAVVVLAALVVAAVVAGLAGRDGLALAALAVLGGWLSVGLLQLRRRLAELAAQLRESQRAAVRAEAGGRRLRELLTQEQRATHARHRELLDALAQSREATGKSVRQLGNQLVRRQRDQTREVEALLQLFAGFTPRAPMPSSGHWALNPTELLELWSAVEQRRPRLVLELGSGTSTVWLGYAVERCGGRLVSVEHDPAYADQTRGQLRRHGLQARAEVRHTPLTDVDVDGQTFHWYDPAAVADLSEVDVLVVDGPPGATGPQARYPAVPLLAPRLSARAAVLLDDADRDDEQEILRRWCEWLPGLTPQPATLGHIAVLSYAHPSAVYASP